MTRGWRRTRWVVSFPAWSISHRSLRRRKSRGRINVLASLSSRTVEACVEGLRGIQEPHTVPSSKKKATMSNGQLIASACAHPF